MSNPTHNPRQVIAEFQKDQKRANKGYVPRGEPNPTASDNVFVRLSHSPIADVAEELLVERDRLAERVQELEEENRRLRAVAGLSHRNAIGE